MKCSSSSTLRTSATIACAPRYQGDAPTRKEIRDRIARTEAGRRAFDLSPREASETIERPADNPEPDGLYGWRSRAWHADKYHWRVETGVPGGGVDISASDGRRRLPIGGPPGSGLVWDRRVGAGARDNDPGWFDLAGEHYWTFYPLLTDRICGISYELRPLDLAVEGPLRWAGREAVRIKGVPGEEWDWGRDPDPLSWGADEYEVVVDTKRGVLLRCASRVRGEDFDALEIEEVHFDEQFPKDTFASRDPLPWR